MATKFDARQSVLRAALGMVGSSANDSLDTIFPKIDAELAKLFEDRNVLLTDGGIITFTGTQLQFTENLNIVLNQKISGASPQVISLGSSTITLANGDAWYAIVNRTAGTAGTAVSSTLPSATSANQEIFLIAKRTDAGDGTQRVYWRNGMALNAGQSVRLGASGSGSGGSGVGDDLGTLLYRASFNDEFSEGPTDSKSAVDTSAGKTDAATYSAAKGMYTLSYDATKTVTAVGTAVTLSGAPAFTVKIGDVIVVPGLSPKRISAVTNQTTFTIESAFSADPTAAACCVSQAIHTKDIYNLAVDGVALSAAFGATTFSEILLDYEDTSSAGDNIFDVNVAPVVAYAASADGTTFTIPTVRPTLETDTWNSLNLPAAGTALYLRFFANKTSGSGTVNLLRYKTWMQKNLNLGPSGGTINDAYAFTNGVGGAVNCSLSVLGGKTTITLGFTYAMGILPGTAASSIKVFLNGQRVPRFISSTLTPDAYFTEVSPSVIQLDRDYSLLNLSIEVVQDTQIVDASTQNTNAISALQDLYTAGYQGFVSTSATLAATTATGTPAAGTFHSTVINRSAMVDLTQDLRARMGIDRVPTGQLYEIQTETTAASDKVWGLYGDLNGAVRMVGTWAQLVGAQGQSVFTSTANDYIEITFNGTGLNIFPSIQANLGRTLISIDGGSEVTVDYCTSSSNGVLVNRNYNQNQAVNVATGLTAGIHTVRIKLSPASVIGFQLFGYEVLNESANMRVAPGISYLGGKKLVLAAGQTFSPSTTFESGSLGSRGGRVVVYQKSDGSIGKAITPAGSQLNLTSADHGSEDLVRAIHFREFGAGRSDDFSTLQGLGATSRAFTLDDGTTSLMMVTGASGGIGFAAPEGIQATTLANYITVTFIGTGLDIEFISDGSSRGYDVTVDNTSVGSFTSTAVSKIVKIVSGLPYGTHVVKFTVNAGGSGGIARFFVYQPKKPTLPSGAVELADYNILATYSATAAASAFSISTGVIRKTPVREVNYTGTTWSVDAPSTSNIDPSGQTVRTSTSGDACSFVFFGTGVELLVRSGASAASLTVQIDGVNYTGAATAVGGTWTAGSANLATATSAGARLQITGLTLAQHTIRVLKATATDAFVLSGFDVITPIHSTKAALPFGQNTAELIGSCAVADTRSITPLKNNAVLNKVRLSTRASTLPTMVGTQFVPVPDMGLNVPVKTAGWFSVSGLAYFYYSGATTAQTMKYAIFVNGVQFTPEFEGNPDSTRAIQSPMNALLFLSPGVHRVEVYWRGVSGSFTFQTGPRQLDVTEL